MSANAFIQRRGLLLLVCVLATGYACAALAQQRLERQVIAAGGGSASGIDHVLSGTIGQPVAGAAAAANHALDAGFWIRAVRTPRVFANGFE